MNSFMNVLVRVRTDRSLAVIARIRGEVEALDQGMARTSGRSLIGSRQIGALSKFGNQLQWTGRMLQYNFTLPLLAAGVASTKFALDQEKNFTHVAKVYGDTSAAAAQFRREMGLGKKAADELAESYKMDELDALDRAFTAISNHYGVQKKEVLEVAGAWAAAGQSGRALAEATQATMTAMIIGDMKAADATKALISIQAQYNLSTKELNATLATFNSIENTTGASMSDLIVGFEKAAGIARSAGIETGQLAAYMAALVPATGSAATAGNALKTIISRLVAPTKESTQVMNAMGLEVDKLSWNSLTVTDRLQVMAEKFQTLSSSQKNVAASVVASRWQVNRFDVLMKEIISTTGYYAKALDSASRQGESFKRMQDELNTVLESNPRKLQRMLVIVQNAMADVIQPLIPFIIYLAQEVGDLARGFAGLNPHVQKLILLGLGLLAMVGPVVRYMGALTTLLAVVGTGFSYAAHGVLAMGKAILFLFSPLKYIGVIATGALGLVSTALQAILAGFASVTLGIVAGVTNGILVMAGATASSVAPIFLGLFSGVASLANGAVMIFVSRVTAMVGASLAAGAAISGNFALMWGAVATATKFWLGKIVGNIIVFGARSSVILTGAWVTIQSTLAGIWSGMALMWAGLSASYTVIWYRIHQGMAIISATFGKAWVAAQAGFSAAWLSIQTLMYRGWSAITAAGYALQQALSVRFWSWMIATWIAGASRVSLIWSAMSLNMVSIMKNAVVMIGRYAAAAFAALTGPVGIAIGIVIGLLYAFRNQLKQIWGNITSDVGGVGDLFNNLGHAIMSVFRSLPEGVQKAMIAVVTVVRDAALAVYDWFSYINPFAHHSPSLVENVTNGMTEVNNQFARLTDIKKYTSAAYSEIKKFGELTRKLGVSEAAAKQAEDRKTLKKAGAGEALVSYNKLVQILGKLTPMLNRLDAQVNAQQRVVDGWQKRVDAANKALDTQQSILDDLQDVLDGYKQKLDDAESAVSRFASTPIEGMREMEEQIFQNQMAQLRLRDEMMRFEDVYGTFDQIKSKLDAINGAQELLRGTQADLRAGGAGSEILSQYDNELAALDQQKDAYKDAADQLADMQAALDALQRQAERLDLTKALKFDEMTHQIELAANRMQELPFEEIMAGIAGANAEIDKYAPLVDQATAAVKAQQTVVDNLTASRDALQSKLDAEKDKLDAVKAKYDEVNDAVQAINQSLQDVLSSADAVAKKTGGKGGGSEYASPGLENFRNAAGAGFGDPGGKGIPMRTDWTNQSDLIDQFTDDLSKQTSNAFEALNPFAPIKKKAGEFWDWFKGKGGEIATQVGDFFGNAFKGVSFGGGGLDFGDFFDKIQSVGEKVTEIIKDIAQVFKWAWDLLGPEVKKIGQGIWDGLKAIWEEVGPELASFGELIEPFGQALKNVWTIIKPVLAVLAGAFLGLAKVILSVVAETIGPILKGLGKIIGNLVQIIKGVIEVIIGIFTLDFSMIGKGLLDIVGGTFGAIWALIEGVGKTIWGVVEGIVKGIYGFFVWLWDVLVGHSVVPDIIDGIVFWFNKLITLAKWVWDNVLKPVFEFFKMAFNLIIGAVKLWWSGLQLAWAVLSTVAQWFWDHVLKPIFDVFVSIWTNFIWPAVQGWWAGLQLAWAALTTAAVWLWDNVLKPIWDGFVAVWDQYIYPAMQAWWAGLQVAWDALKTAATWLWDNVLKPVFNKVKELWDDKVKPAFAYWWEGIKLAWNTLKTIGQWLWDNVLNPIVTKVKEIWTNYVQPALSTWFEGFKTSWDNLKKLAQWVWDNVMGPVVDKVKEGWNQIKKWMEDSKDMLKDGAKGIVNGLITVINALIGGLNKISDILPGDINWHIDPIEKLAAGGPIPGRSANRGFMTRGARAIVGEGKANYPEFVIPTDPTHRNRAVGLLAMAAAKIGVTQGRRNVQNVGGDSPSDFRALAKANPANTALGIPEYGIGGWLSSAFKGVKGIADWFEDKGWDAIAAVSKPAFAAARLGTKAIPWNVPRALAMYNIDKSQDWVNNLENQLKEEEKKSGALSKGGAANVAGALTFARSQVGKPYVWGGVGPDGYDCSGFMSALTNVLNGRPAYSRVGATGSFPWAGFSTGNINPRGFVIGSSPNYKGTGVGHMAGTLGNTNVESAGGVGVRVGGSARGYLDSGFTVHAGMTGLKYGGIVRRRVGGILANIGEGNHDEAVVPLPRDWRSGLLNKGTESDSKTYNFYGDLSFPNITSPDDAQTFLDNLDALAKD